MSDPRSPRVRSAEETILDLHAKIESDAEVIAALIERLRSFGPDWTKKITGSIAPYEVCANAADRIESDARYIEELEGHVAVLRDLRQLDLEEIRRLRANGQQTGKRK